MTGDDGTSERPGWRGVVNRTLHDSRVSAMLRDVCPPSWRSRASALRSRISPPNRTQVFASIHRNAGWGSEYDSVSGPGSTLEETAVLRRELPVLLRQIGARSLLDAPCGDLHWMKECELGIEEYIGIDVVEDIVAANTERYGGPGRRFMVGDIVNDDLPLVDVILCRDCLVHLPYDDVLVALRNFRRSGSTYLLTTTFPDHRENNDLSRVGDWRTLDLTRPPFDLPAPLELLIEECTFADGRYADKSLGLWRLADLRV